MQHFEAGQKWGRGNEAVPKGFGLLLRGVFGALLYYAVRFVTKRAKVAGHGWRMNQFAPTLASLEFLVLEPSIPSDSQSLAFQPIRSISSQLLNSSLIRPMLGCRPTR